MKSESLKVLIVEDDVHILDLITKAISAMDFRPIQAANIASALQHATSDQPDLVILDLGLPDGNGISFVNSYRQWSSRPVLVLSARMQEHEKVKVLDAGADDYLTKPFGTAELMARIRALLRRQGITASNTPKFLFGEIAVDLSSRKVTKADQEIHLSPIEYQLLSVLLTHHGRVVTHRQLLKEVWGGQHMEDHHYLRIYVGHLRHKLEDNPTQPKFLLTETGVGYRLEI